MDCQKIENDKCRICLERGVELDWNDYLLDHLTYKDCYYKYTHLDCFDGDNLFLSSMLCRNCANSLENINAFISKAIETHKLLQERLTLSIEIKSENDNDVKTSFETIMIEEADIKPDILHDQSYEYKSKECFDEYNDTSCVSNISDDTATSKKHSRTKRKRNLIKSAKKLDNTKTSSNELQNERRNPKKNNHCSNPWEIPTCCSICSKVLTSKYKAIAHEKIHLKNRERNETCEECGMKFFSKSALRSHMATHVQNREKVHKCEYCDKAFFNSGARNIHRRIHLGQMVPCKLCPKEFFRQVDLDKHMNSHSATRIDGELKPKKKYFVCCEICGENVRSSQYKSHSAKHMNEPLAKCAICNKEYFSRDSCISHLKKFHKKGRGERSNFVISCKTTRYSSLYLQQNVGKIFTQE